MHHTPIRGKLMVSQLLLLCGGLQLLRPCSAFSLSAPRAAPRRAATTSPHIRPPGSKERSNTSGFPSPKFNTNTMIPSSSGFSTDSEGRGMGRLGAQGVETEQPEQQQQQQQQQEQEQEQEEGFRWTRQWYPVAVMRDLEARDARQPYPVQLLGEALVVWKDPKDGGWKAFADRCPHRWAPLSEGRVDQKTGRLQCIYHGWEFQGDGKCGSIPQARPESRDAAQNSKRACATVIPTKIVEDKLWLWPDSSPEGVRESERVQPVTVPGLDLESGEFGGNWFSRDLAYGADSLVENLVDPAHVPYAHHGVMGSRAFGSPMAIEIDDESATGEDEFVTKKTGYVGNNVMRVGFRAPGLIYYESDYTEGLAMIVKRMPPPFRALFWAIKKLNVDKKLSMKDEDRKEKGDRLLTYFIGYAVPTTPGKCRIFTRTCRNFFLQHPVIPRRFRNSLAKEHLAQQRVLDGDSVILHVQERFLAGAGEQGVKRPEKTFYMPTDSDTPIRRFRRWYHSRGGDGPTWAKGVDPSDLGPVLPREEILDRLNAHTKDCAACGKAMRVSATVKRLSAWGTLLLLAAAAAAPRGMAPVRLATGALASACLSVAMRKREQRFIFVDYVHAKLDD
eukprot:g12737.t1